MMRFPVLFAAFFLVSLGRSTAQEQFRIIEVLDFQRTSVRNFTFCPTSRRLFVSHTDAPDAKYDDRLYQWELATRKVEHVYRVGKGFIPDNLTLSPDCRVLIAGCWPLKGSDCKVLLLDVQRHQIAYDLHHKWRIFGVSFSADGSRFAIATPNPPPDQAVVYDTSARQIRDADLADFQPTKNPYVWYQSPVGKVDEKSGLYCKDATGVEHKLDVDQWHNNYGATADGRYIAASTWDGELIVWRRSDVKEVFRQRMAQQYGYLRYDPAEDRFLWADATRGTTKLKALVIEAPK